MLLQLAENTSQGYTFVPYSDELNSDGAYVRNDVLQKAYDGLNDSDLLLSGFFGSLWGGIKSVVSTGVKLVTGGGQSSQQPTVVNVAPPVIQQPQAGISTNMLLIGGAALAAILLLKK